MAKRDVEGQMTAFPELDDSDESKALMRSVRKYVKKKEERDSVLGIQKEEMDKAMSDVVVKMKECKLTKFHYDSLTVEIVPGKEKIKVKADPGDDDEDDSESDDE